MTHDKDYSLTLIELNQQLALFSKAARHNRWDEAFAISAKVFELGYELRKYSEKKVRP